MKKYYAGLNLYRFLAAAMVAFFFHYRIVLGDSPFAGTTVGDFLNANGGYVVELFFIISGFVAYNAYLKRISDGTLKFKEFIIGRIKRMYPTLIISVTVVFVLMWLGYAIWDTPLIKDSATSPFAFILNMLGLNGGIIAESAFVSVNGPSWYVSVLMVCYLLFFVISLFSHKSEGGAIVLFIVVIIIGLFVYLNPVNLPFLSLSCARGYIYFFIGVIWAKIQSRLSFKGSIITCVLSVVMILMFVFAYYHDLLYQESLEVGLCIVLPLVLIGLNVSGFNKICDNRPVRFLGNISYGIFMWNIPTFVCVRLIEQTAGIDFDYGNIWVYLAIVVINIIAGTLSYEFIEKQK